MRIFHHLLIVLAGVVLQACGGGQSKTPLASSGQVVATAATTSQVSAYAAARFLEQAAWGPTPAAVQRVQALGFEGWLDWQLGLAPSLMVAPDYVIDYDDSKQTEQQRAHNFITRKFWDLAVAGEDQLRQRMNWALYNFIVVGRVGYAYGAVTYFNTVQGAALGSFGDLIVDVTRNPLMGEFLNNDQNRANSPNENYARELMQLFTVGLVRLNPDGSVQRDASGRPLETYTQQDVIEATRALSGWQKVYDPFLPNTNRSNYGVPMEAATWNGAHDFGQKQVLGASIPANQSTAKDLERLVEILVNHPNTAPFVATRLIQALVTSNPSPAYVARVAQVFRDSGGQLGQVAKAVLLDPDARAGDTPGQGLAGVGKIKEPVLVHANILRGLGCEAGVQDAWSDNNAFSPWTQEPYKAPSVFGYFPPNHLAPESLTPAPEQKLLTGQEFERRASHLSNQLRQGWSNFEASACDVGDFLQALNQSDAALLDLINQRFFKSAMPVPLRYLALNLLKGELAGRPATERVAETLTLLTSSPSFGVLK